MNLQETPYSKLYNFKQKIAFLENQCRNGKKNVKETLCHDAKMVLEKACNTIEKLVQQKNNATIEKDYSVINKIENEIHVIESTAINLANLDILFREKYTDDVVEPYTGLEIEKEKRKKLEEEIQKMNEIENAIKIEQKKIKKQNEEMKEKERIKLLKKDEYINELEFHDIKKNTSIKNSSIYRFFNESIKDDKKNINNLTDNNSEYNFHRKNSNIFTRSNSMNEKNKSNNIEFSNQINNTIERLLNPISNSPTDEVRHNKVNRKGPTEAEVRTAMNKVKEEKYEELNCELDKHYAEIEKILNGDN